MPDEIVSESQVYQIIKKYCDGIIKCECEHADTKDGLNFPFGQ